MGKESKIDIRKEKLEKAIKDAELLYQKITDASKLFDRNFISSELEVQFRWDSIRGILLIAGSDAYGMLTQWREEKVKWKP